jgi:hypothetical protein
MNLHGGHSDAPLVKQSRQELAAHHPLIWRIAACSLKERTMNKIVLVFHRSQQAHDLLSSLSGFHTIDLHPPLAYETPTLPCLCSCTHITYVMAQAKSGDHGRQTKPPRTSKSKAR